MSTISHVKLRRYENIINIKYYTLIIILYQYFPLKWLKIKLKKE